MSRSRGGPSSEGSNFELPYNKPEEHDQILDEPPDNPYKTIIALLSKIAETQGRVADSALERSTHYEISETVTTAQTSTTLQQDSNLYTRERVFDRLDKNAPKLYFYNDGPGNLYVRSTHDGQNFTNEWRIYEGEHRTFFNVYELRHRGDTTGLSYRISEFPSAQQIAVSKAERIEVYSTDKDVQFTGAIVMNAHEKVNLTGLLSNKYMIRGVNIQSKQNLKFRLIFWSSDQFDNIDLDLDYYIDDVELDMTSSPAFQIGGANQYYLNVGSLSIIYEDFDATRELHISLQNESPVAKIAGTNGQVQLDIKMTPRV